jgi:class 3 adenylate cyclase/tetratricopeptide (TPR) repeat protein
MRQERKVVTCLFCDLVGFTSRAEEMDPEDVAAMLGPYHTRLKTELERYGGTVEKFIGDAVMALFGAPRAHEDDPERAVRAALAIRDFAAHEAMELRIGITTGEALVDLDARPEQGETMATGDVINTAARLQSAASVNGILVSQKTYEATRLAIEFESAAPVEAKGKSQPVPVWKALRARARVSLERLHDASLVGRRRELDLLADALARARQERSPQLVTLVGVPGIGKSRLVYELFTQVENDPELIFWRHGRCLSYGDGVTFWALGEMVKAEAGVFESDSAEETEAKLRSAVEDEWVRGHLRPLVGLSTDTEPAADRAEVFAAWRTFFETLAEQSPLVLVFEDLHWADESLLDFVDHLVDWASGAPLLVVCTARPELLERRPAWGGGKPDALTLSLSPLSDEETARLVAELLDRPLLEAETQAALIARAGGNPLYAEQYARMLEEGGPAKDLRVPETVQGIIAARLDGLAPEEKAVLQDASVLGKTVALGAVAFVSGLEPRAIEERLHALERKEFVRRERRATLTEETEYSFRHLLVRDVAYGQIPRADRADKHRRAAEWIESLGRSDDHVELVAHHYSSALEYVRAAGEDTEELSERARVALRDAGDRAWSLNSASTAKRLYEAAVALWPTGDPERPKLLFSLGRALCSFATAGDVVLEEARDGLLEQGDRETAAEAEILLGELRWKRGQRDPAFEHFHRAEDLVVGLPVSFSKAYVVSQLSRFLMLANENEEAIRLGQEAVAMADELGDDELRAHALNNIGSARVARGDLEGVCDLERSVEISVAINSPESVRAYGNLGSTLGNLGELERSWKLNAEGLRAAERFGLDEPVRWLTTEHVFELYERGRWEEALFLADRLIAGFEESRFWMESAARNWRGRMRLARADTSGAREDADRGILVAREGKDLQVVLPALAFGAHAALAGGSGEEASTLAAEIFRLCRERGWEIVFGDWLPGLAAVVSALGYRSELLEVAASTQTSTRWLEAAVAYVSGDCVRAAEIYAAMGSLPAEAEARLRAAERLEAEGRGAEAPRQLQPSLAFWRSVGATRYIREAEALLAASA